MPHRSEIKDRSASEKAERAGCLPPLFSHDALSSVP